MAYVDIEIKPGYMFTSKTYWFPFEPEAWIGSESILAMTDKEYRSYLTLLCFQWKNNQCMLRYDVEKLKSLPGIFKKNLIKNSHVMDNFNHNYDGYFYNEKLYQYRIDAELLSLKRRSVGKKGGRPKNQLDNQEQTNSLPIAKQVKDIAKDKDTNNVTVNVKGLTLTGDFTGYSNDEIVGICLGLEPEDNRGPKQQEYWAKKVGYWTRQGKISQFMDQLYDATKSNVDNPASLLVKNTRVL